MSLVEKYGEGPTRPGRKTIGALPKFLLSLSDEEREAAQMMLLDPSWPSSEIWEAFLAEGMDPIASSTFRGARIEFMKESV